VSILGGEPVLTQQPDPEALANARIFTPAPISEGPLRSADDAQHLLQPTDHLEIPGNDAPHPPQVRITSPTGTQTTISLPNGCSPNCETTVNLVETFGPEPADGTWTGRGRHARTLHCRACFA
jgi:hypothetical protein